jgi:hypothetical protein
MINETPGTHIKALNTMHKAFVAGQIVFAAIAFYLVYSGMFIPHQKQLEKPLQLISVLLSVGGFIVGNLIFKNRIGSVIGTRETVSKKLYTYRVACIIQWALIELACLFSISGFMLTGDYSFLFLAGALILTFVMLSPAKDKVVFQLQLTNEEAAQL